MADVLSTQISNLSWRRDLIGNKLVMWNNLVSHLSTIVLSQQRNGFKWNLDHTSVFSGKSHYPGLINQNTPNLNTRIWKLKAPLKIKFFLWYLKRGVILTKDNLTKRNWQGNQQCCFCHENETIQHLFLTADLRECYGLQSMRPGTYQNLTICLVCLGAGSIEFLKNISH